MTLFHRLDISFLFFCIFRLELSMIKIMKMQFQLVLGHDCDHLVRLFPVGDLPSVENQQNAQENPQDSSSSLSKLGG